MTNESAERRAQSRKTVLTGTMLVEGSPYPVADWSRNGFRVRAETGFAARSQPFDFVLGIRDEAGTVEVRGRGQVVRQADGHVAGTWDLRKPAEPYVEEILAAFLAAGAGPSA
ncbi:MAG: hypothetical protein NBV67_12935 [Tagaea sp.]|nr:hypothetical protein [Tagaea sp.]